MILDVQNISFRYRVKPVLQEASFQARSGEVICLLGCNGAGKSTIFRCI